MAFGRTMAEGLESGEATGDAVLDLAMAGIPKFELMDKEFRSELPNGKKKIILLCKPDTSKSDYSSFKEYKTGQEKWTRAKVDAFGQITFYATGIYLLTGRIPSDIELVHVETEKDPGDPLGGKIRATGDIHRHPTKRSMQDILVMMVRMKKAWAQIERISEKELF